MTVTTFIKDNREEIDQRLKIDGITPPTTDEGRRLWVLNDKDLYDWAKEKGVFFPSSR